MQWSVYLFDTSLGGRLPKFRWDVIWLPFGPFGYVINLFVSIFLLQCLHWEITHAWNRSGAGVCLYVDHLLLESSEEIRKLRAYTYSYKAYWKGILVIVVGFELVFKYRGDRRRICAPVMFVVVIYLIKFLMGMYKIIV